MFEGSNISPIPAQYKFAKKAAKRVALLFRTVCVLKAHLNVSGQLRIGGGRSSGALIGTANELSRVEMSMRRVGDSEGALAGGEIDGDSMHRERAQSFPRFGRDDVVCTRKYSQARRCKLDVASG